MPPEVEFEYQGFLSYSHRDKRWANWLHRRLEHYRVDEALHGMPSSHGGKVPKSLKPICRDREAFHVGGTLGDEIKRKLDASAALIVICSPEAAKSPYVQEEIAHFKTKGRGARVFPFVVKGNPGNECFPEMLRAEYGLDGRPTGKTIEPLAADARWRGDGKEFALLKLVASMLGVRFEAVSKREHAQQRRRLWRTRAAAAAVGMLAFIACGFGYWAWQANERSEKLVMAMLVRAQELVVKTAELTNQYGVPTKVTQEYLLQAWETYDRVKVLGGERPALQFQRAKLNLEFSKVYAALGDKKQQLGEADKAVEIFKKLEADAQPDPDRLSERALRWWRSALRIEPGNGGAIERWLTSWRTEELAAELRLQRELKQAYFFRGEAYRANSRRQDALDDFNAGLAVSERGVEKRELVAEEEIIDAKLLLGQAQVHYTREQFHDALKSTRAAIEKLEVLRSSVRSREGRLQLADAYLTAADAARVVAVRLRQRTAEEEHFVDAVRFCKRGLDEAKALYDTQRENPELARLLARGHMINGDILKARRLLQQAFEAYEASLKLRNRLHERDRHNFIVKYELGWSLMKIAETRREWPDNRNPSLAVQTYEQAIRIFEDLWSRGHAPSRRSAWLALWGTEMPLAHLGETQADKLIATMERKRDLARQSPIAGDGDIAFSHVELGDLLLQRGRTAHARTEFDAAIAATQAEFGVKRPPGTREKHRARAYLGLAKTERLTREAHALRPARDHLDEARRLLKELRAAKHGDIDLVKLEAEVLFETSQVLVGQRELSEAHSFCKSALARIEEATRASLAPIAWHERSKAIKAECEEILRRPAS